MLSKDNSLHAGTALVGVFASSSALILLFGLWDSVGSDSGSINGLIHAAPALAAVCISLLLPLWFMFRHLGRKQCELGPSLHLVAAFSLYISLPAVILILAIGFCSAPFSSFPSVVGSALAAIILVGGPLFCGGWMQMARLKRRHNILFRPDCQA